MERYTPENIERRRAFLAWREAVRPEDVYFADETGFNFQTDRRNRGRALEGQVLPQVSLAGFFARRCEVCLFKAIDITDVQPYQSVTPSGGGGDKSPLASSMERKEYQCKKCRVHGVDIPLKGHKGKCPWEQCACEGCEQVKSYRRQHMHDGRAMTAVEVIDIANMKRGEKPKKQSAKDKVTSKQQARGVRNTELYRALNRSMEELAQSTPTVHPAHHLRKACLDFSAESKSKSKSKGKATPPDKYSYVSTAVYKSYPVGSGSSHRQDYPRPGSSRQDDFPRPSSSYEGNYPRPGSSRQDDFPRPSSSYEGNYPRPGSSRQDDFPRPSSSYEDNYPRPGSSRQDDFPRPSSSYEDDYPRPGSSRQDDFPRPSSSYEDNYPRPGSSRQDDFPRPSSSYEDDYPRPGSSRQADMDDDVRRLTEMFPGAQQSLGLSLLYDIRATAGNMDSTVDQLIGILKPTTPSPKRSCPPRLTRLSTIFPKVDRGILAAVSQQAENTPSAVETVMRLFHSPDIRPTPVCAPGGRSKRRGRVLFGGSEVKHTPGWRTPRREEETVGKVVNFNKTVEAALQAAEEAQEISGGATYSITRTEVPSCSTQGRPTPVKKRIVTCKQCGEMCDRRQKFCHACGGIISNREERY
ncbi:DMRTB1 [Branchiostoma lanceolatum]|uniref:DMRTB1 protein n=1 Tax=Branchiostoma lanceolatum TaxID=7740 RepID=A0A8J9ZTX9_BRALA|nr:DMRTB1 [Branchiostoma lanceolatum]